MTASLNAPAGILIEEWRPAPSGTPSLDMNAEGVEDAEDIEAVDDVEDAEDIAMLGEILHAVVHDGAGVSFIVPFSLDEARAFWVDRVLPGVRARTRRVVVARQGRQIVGTVQLDLAVPPNQRHRAEVMKLLVHPSARRRGIARALMVALEAIAQAEGRTLLTLDTWTGGSAETLYRSLGYIAIGVIPRYARGSLTPALEPATFMYKELSLAMAAADTVRSGRSGRSGNRDGRVDRPTSRT